MPNPAEMPENYISDKLIADFEEINGCTVNLTYMDSVADRDYLIELLSALSLS